MGYAPSAVIGNHSIPRRADKFSIERYVSPMVVAYEHHFTRPWVFDDPAKVARLPLVAVFYSRVRYAGIPVLVFAQKAECDLRASPFDRSLGFGDLS